MENAIHCYTVHEPNGELFNLLACLAERPTLAIARWTPSWAEEAEAPARKIQKIQSKYSSVLEPTESTPQFLVLSLSNPASLHSSTASLTHNDHSRERRSGVTMSWRQESTFSMSSKSIPEALHHMWTILHCEYILLNERTAEPCLAKVSME